MTDYSNNTPLTELLRAAQAGDQNAQDQVGKIVYDELYSLARSYLNRERSDHTLQPTALVHEAYLRLVDQVSPWKNRAHFFGIAAQMMRRVLVDYARRSSANRRDRQMVVSLDAAETIPTGKLHPDSFSGVENVIAVHEALNQLEQLDQRQARIVELRFFVGLSLEEISEVLDVSPATVSRDWSMARAWLKAQLSDT